MQKVLKMIPKLLSWGAFGSTLGIENDSKVYNILVLGTSLCTPISEGLLARIVAETGSKLHVRNSVWTAPARADPMLTILRQTCPATTDFKDFGVVLGAKSSHLGHFGLTMTLKWIRSGKTHRKSMGPRQNPGHVRAKSLLTG